MRRVSPLVALSALALIAGARPTHAAPAADSATARKGSDRPAAPPLAAVTSISIVPGEGRADVVIAVQGAVDIQDFTLASPHRVVVDITGARLGVPPRLYDKVSRAGITDIRVAQYKADVVRLVLDLAEEKEYTVVRADADVRVSVPGSARFAAWHAAGGPDAKASDSTRRPRDSRRGDPDELQARLAAETAERDAAASDVVRVDGGNHPTTTFLAGRGKQRSQQPRMTVTWNDADIHDVLAGFAAFSGRTIVVGKTVTGEVNAEIKDQPWDVALQAILQ